MSSSDTATSDRATLHWPGLLAPAYAEMPEVPAASRPAPRLHGGPSRLGLALLSCGVVMLPWLAVLATSLPATARASHWPAAWVGLDALEALGLISTGWLLRRGNPAHCLAAAATAALLVTDAWFDVMTATPGAGLAISLAMAAFPELPLAALLTVLALRSVPRPPGAEPRRGASSPALCGG